MAMDRRDFLRLAAASGLALCAPLASSVARAEPYTGTLWLMVNASGGWDPTSLCDPKGRRSEADEDPMNMYMSGDIGTAGPFKYAPFEGYREFFEKYQNRMTIINGIDTETNGHDSGSRHIWSGHLQEGHPSFAALAASHLNKEAPMAYISNGGYDVTAGLVARTRSGSTDALARIAYPNRADATREDRNYHSENTVVRIRAAQKERLLALRDEQHLRRVQAAMDTLFTARLGQNEVKRLTEFLPPLDSSNNPLFRQAQVAIAAYKAGICVSANLSVGGFDTHSRHDQGHIPRMQSLIAGVDFIMSEAERQGVQQDVVVLVGSDFGRTPGYNDGDGKDHWPVTSMMFLGKGFPGGRLIGGTTERHGLMRVNPTTLQTLPDTDNNGVRIKPAHIHRQLRKLVGIDGDDVDRSFPLSSSDVELKLFT